MATNMEIFYETMQCLKYLVDKTAENCENSSLKRKPSKLKQMRTFVVKINETSEEKSNEAVYNSADLIIHEDQHIDTVQIEIETPQPEEQSLQPIESTESVVLATIKVKRATKGRKAPINLVKTTVFKPAKTNLSKHMFFSFNSYIKKPVAHRTPATFKKLFVNDLEHLDSICVSLKFCQAGSTAKNCFKLGGNIQLCPPLNKQVSIIFRVNMFDIACLYFYAALYLRRKACLIEPEPKLEFQSDFLLLGEQLYPQINFAKRPVDLDHYFICNLELESELAKWLKMIVEKNDSDDRMETEEVESSFVNFAMPDIIEYESVVKTRKPSFNRVETLVPSSAQCASVEPPSHQVPTEENMNEMQVDSVSNPATQILSQSESQNTSSNQVSNTDSIFAEQSQLRNHDEIQTQLLKRDQSMEIFNEVTERRFISFKPTFVEPKAINVMLSNGFMSTQCGTIIEIQQPSSRPKLVRTDTIVNKEILKSQLPAVGQTPIQFKPAKKRAFMKVGLLKSQKIKKHLHSNVKPLN
jgi:hypothetical protein